MKYLRVQNNDLLLLDSIFNTIEESDIKVSDEVFEYYLTSNVEYNLVSILEKEITTVNELKKYLKPKEDIKIEDIVFPDNQNEKILIKQLSKLTLDNKAKDDLSKKLIETTVSEKLERCKLEKQNKMIISELIKLKLEINKLKEGK